MGIKLTTKCFVNKAIEIHGNRYDYSKVVYTNRNTKVCIVCPKHGCFWQTPANHLWGYGCKRCGIDRRAAIHSKSKYSFIEESNRVHDNKYDYSKVEYVNNRTKVCIICPEHGEFWQTPANHLKKQGCPECAPLKRAESRKNHHKNKRPDLSHIETPPGSKAVPVGTKGDYALVDDEDYERVMQYNWNLSGTGYITNKTVGLMHRFIMNPPDDMEVDHIFHNRFDNRKSQLRICTHQENGRNTRPRSKTSKYKGVSWNKRDNNWVVKITIEGKQTHVGYFTDEEEAARAYDEAAKRHFKDFARLNFPNRSCLSNQEVRI